MSDTMFQSIAIIALLVGNGMLVALGFLAARSYFAAANGATEAEQMSGLRQDVKGVTLSLAAVSERLAKLEIQISQFRENMEQDGSPNRDSDQKTFKIATKLALQGADAEEIVELCGLARGEAELIRMLHSNNQMKASDLPGDPLDRPSPRAIDFSGVNGHLDPDRSASHPAGSA
ncbi:MAG: DUF2802 domain-containing protein [Candidatus Competibacteraceae bacterium]|nr:MAG: DUF2802 domain-containing protein [Candidatus Competibacteraceae bacterium]